MGLFISYLLFASSIACLVASVLCNPKCSDIASFTRDHEIATVNGSSSINKVAFRFEAECPSCSDLPDSNLTFDVSIFQAAGACEPGRIYVNDVPLNWFGEPAEGAGTLLARPSPWLDGNTELDASWWAACTTENALLLSFGIRRMRHDLVNDDSGFTILFRQTGQPELLRLLGKSVDLKYAEALQSQWKFSDSKSSVTLVHPQTTQHTPTLDNELQQLQSWEQESLTLAQKSLSIEKAIEEQKSRICEQLRDDTQPFCSKLEECTTLKCYFLKIWHKASNLLSTAWRLLKDQKTSSQSPFQGIRKQGDGAVMYGGMPSSSQSDSWEGNSHDKIDDWEDNPKDELGDSAPAQKTSATTEIHQASSSARPTRDLQSAPLPTAAVPKRPASQNVTRSEETDQPQFDGEYSPNIMPTKRIVFFVGVALFLTLATFVATHHIRICCTRSRGKKGRSCARTHRRSRLSHTKAASRQRWRDWLDRRRHYLPTDDYEEKRTLVLQQEGIIEDAMQEQIRDFTSPEQVERDLTRAEEGRSTLYLPATIHHSSHILFPPVLPDTTNPPDPPIPNLSHPLRRTDSLPSYRRNSGASSRSTCSSNPPPQYEEDFSSDMDVVDGFSFSPVFGRSHASDSHHRFESDGFAESVDTSPDSSVVDCSPRMSFDTGRTMVSRKGEAAPSEDGVE